MKCQITVVAIAAAVSLIAVSGTTQNHNLGWVVPSSAGLHSVSSSGGVTTRTVGTTYAATMNRDNKTALVFDPTNVEIIEIDPVTLAVIGTFFKTPSFRSAQSVTAMAFDSNGDLYFSGTFGTSGIFRHTPGSASYSTVVSSPTFFLGVGSLALHHDTGELIATEQLRATTSLFYVRRDGTQTTVIATGLSTRHGSYQHIPTGDIFSGTCCSQNGGGGNASILVIRQGQTVATKLIDHPVLRGGYAPRPDRASSASQRIITTAWNDFVGGDGIWQVDLAGPTATKLATIVADTYKAAPIFGRNLQSIATGRGQWVAQVSFPQHPGKRFAVGFTLGGLRPGLRLPDGRLIPIVVDQLTALSLTANLAPLIQRNQGQLSAAGTAIVQMDLRSLGAAANGFVIHLVPVVLDPIAPVGIAVIGDPRPLVIEGI